MADTKKFPARRFIVMVVGLFIMSFGILMFELSLTGNDPCNAFLLALSNKLHVRYAYCSLGTNVVFFAFEFLLARKYIGIGTFANWFLVGPVADLFNTVLSPVLPVAETVPLKLMYMVPGILVLSLSVSLYQTADLGIAPYDALALILRDRVKLPFVWARILVDGFFALAAWLLGGLIGLGTVVCAFGLGPFISFFDKTVSKPLLGMKG